MQKILIPSLVAFALSTAPVSAQSGYEMNRDEEVVLAMSAGPHAVSAAADVYVFGADGFELAIEGSNGFSCLVVRQAGAPEVLAPHCLSPDATASVLPAKLAEGRWIARGLDPDDVTSRLSRGFDSGDLPLPSGQAYAYMLSSGQQLGAAGKWLPHFMLYMPYATNEDVGGVPGDPHFPFVGPEIGHPHSTMVVVMRDFVHPDDVMPRR